MKEITSEVVNAFLSGHDPMERIISIECDYQEDQVNIVYVDENGVKRIRKDDFKPFIWVKQSAAIRLFNGDRNRIRSMMRSYGIAVKALITSKEGEEANERLENGYKFLFYATRKMSNKRFQQFFTDGGVPINERAKKGEKRESNREYMTVTPIEQYMIASGKRLFKGYESYDDLNRFIFDLETQGLNPKIHRIEQIGIHTNKGFDKVIAVEGKNEDELNRNELNAIEEFLKILASLKPDTVVGHNSENFDWDFLIVRCEQLGEDFSELSLKYFRHPIYKRKKETVLKLGGEIEYYYPTIMWGHNVLDSLHAARRAQAIDSNMKSSNLKYVTKYLNLKKENRVYVPGEKITSTWNETEKVFGFCDKDGDWYRVTETRPLLDGYELVSGRYIVERYLLDDLWETDKVEDRLNESNFLVGKMLPTSFTRACTMGTAGIWKLIMLAWCYENELAIPASVPNKRFTGGLSRLLKTGFVPRIVKLDYNSLYPSVILTWHVSTPIDVMNVMLSFLEYILTQREKYKELKAEAGNKADALKECLKKCSDKNEKSKIKEEINYWKAEKSGNDKKQLPLKILANSFFGGYGSPNVFPFGDILAAEKTTCISRMSLRLMISHFQSIGYEPIVGDSVTYDTPIIVRGEDKRIDIMPICDMFNNDEAIEFDKEQYRDFSKKNYNVLTRDGWKPIEYVYKHKTNKQLKRVETKNGLIDCTEDHSLFDNEGNEVKPSTLTRGDKIEIYTKDIDYFASSTVTDKEAWLFGFFMADGSSVYCDRTQKYYSKRKGEWVSHKGKRANWKISNKSLDRLNKAKEIMEDSFCLKASIKDHMNSSNVYNLVVENVENAKFFSNNFYTSYRYKKVPEFILNAKKEVKKAFLDGFCCGDGQNDTIDECIEFGQKSKVAMAGLYFLMKELGYNFRCHNRNDKQEFISFRLRNHRGNLLNEAYSSRKENEIWNCGNITSKSEYVYDISADGTFVNALGMIVCHNTDGFNFQMPETFRYTDEHPYISNGAGRNSIKDKAYTLVDADVAEFEDLYMSKSYDGGINKMGLGIDEYCDACIQFARKNYADLMPDGSTKKVGNTIKSRKMSGYLEKFIDEGVDLLLHGNGYKFLSNYYDYIEKIYNYQIPIKDIASKGNIKKTIKDYIADCKTLTKAGSKKSRQAWYELVIKEGVNVNVSDTIYYINTGTKRAHSDVKRITHYYYYDDNGHMVDITKEVEKLYKAHSKEYALHGVETKKTRMELAKENYGKTVFDEDEIILNCKLVPKEILDKEEDVLCSDYEGLEYNVEKYIDQFNKRITPLLVCFHPDIRDKILITNPKDKQYFTEEQSKLVSGFPNKEEDQDTFEALMTPERKEVEFWLKVGEVPPFVKECGIDWDEIVRKHEEEVKEEQNELFEKENTKYLEALDSLTNKDVEELENEGKLPSSIASIMTLGSDMRLYFKKIPNKTPSTGGFVFDDISYSFIETNDG